MTTATASEILIFAGRKGSGSGFRFYFPADGLLDIGAAESRPARVERVEEDAGGEFRVVETGWPYLAGGIPREATEAARGELRRRVDAALARAGRIVSTPDSYEAACALSATFRVLGDPSGGYAIEITETSRWAGEKPRRVSIDPERFGTLAEAKGAAWRWADRPSYGDPYVPHP